jgi:hypothetical protein
MPVTTTDRFLRRIDIVTSKAQQHGIDATELAANREQVAQTSIATMGKFAAVLARMKAKEREGLTVRSADNWPIRDRVFVNTVGAIVRADLSFDRIEPDSIAILHKVLWEPTGEWVMGYVQPRANHGEVSAILDIIKRRDWETTPTVDGVGIEGFAVLYAAWQAMQGSRSTTRIRIGNTNPNRAVIGAMTTVSRGDLPAIKGKGSQKPKTLKEKACIALEHQNTKGKTTILVYQDNEPVQLQFDVTGFDTEEQLIAQLAASPERMVKHWVALHSLLTTSGTVLAKAKWEISTHMATLGYRPQQISDQRCRDRVVKEMKALLRMRVRLEKNGETFHQGPLFHFWESGRIMTDEQGNKHDLLTTFDLTISPALYDGVLPSVSLDGREKENWVPLPPGLPKRSPEAVALGAVLASRFRAFCCGSRCRESYIPLKGQNAIRLAGIPYRSNDPGRALTSLERALGELRDEHLVRSWTWQGEGNVLERTVYIDPHDDFLDVAQHHLERVALPPKQPANGTELTEWRKKRGLSQAAASERIGASLSTIKRAERGKDKPLPVSLRKLPNESWA